MHELAGEVLMDEEDAFSLSLNPANTCGCNPRSVANLSSCRKPLRKQQN